MQYVAFIVLLAGLAVLAVTLGYLVTRGGRDYLHWAARARRTCRLDGCDEMTAPGDDCCSDEHAQAETDRLRWDLYR